VPRKPVVCYRDLQVSLSSARIRAYSKDDDQDSDDAIARYMWNMAIGSALWPALHVLEVTIRNAFYEVGASVAKNNPQPVNRVPCWLTSGLLLSREQDEVDKALKRLVSGHEAIGHLIAELTFGFWVQLCNSPYEHGKSGTARIWPDAAIRFLGCPRHLRERRTIQRELNYAKDLRNTVAHHHPIWDRNPVRQLNEVVKILGWMNPGMAEAVRQTSNVASVVAAGHQPFRPLAAAISSAAV